MTVRKYDTKYGPIYVSTPGPFHAYDNLRTYQQTENRVIQLQGPALRAFKNAEERFTRPRYQKRGKIEHILITGHGYRSYALQSDLHNQDGDRYADPDASFHVEQLAVDLDQEQPRLAAAQDALKAEGWHWGLAFGDRPHWSFRLVG